MARFVIERHSKSKPLWLLSVLAAFPFDSTVSYPDADRYSMLASVLDYLEDFKYLRRNSWECLGVTHHIKCTDTSITVSSRNDVPYLTIYLIAEQ